MIKKFIHVIKKHWPFYIAALVLSVLLLRNPYSERTLIPNFEPFPDSFHYIVPPQCFLQGQGWRLCREGLSGVKPAVPPLYGSLFLPLFLFGSDPQSFYFANIVLTFISLTFLYLLTKKITKNQFVQLLVVILFTTTYQVYWVPTLAMAENLLLPTLLGAFYLMSFKKLTKINIVAISTFAGLLYGSKFAGLPLMVGICLVLGIRIISEHFTEKLSWKETIQKIALAVIPVLSLFIAFGGWKTIATILQIDSLFKKTTEPETTSAASNSWFGLEYFETNFAIYLQTARGEATRFLWDYTPLVSWWMATLGWLGLGYGITKKRWRWISLTALTTVLLQLSIIATFYSADTRYIYNLLPTVLVGFILFFVWLKDILKTYSVKRTGIVISLLALILLGGYSVQNFTRLKSQASINIRYAETPWWYLAIREMNTYIESYNQNKTEKKETIVISPIVPYLVDFYTTADFSLLPLDQMQDFRGAKNEVWGENDYSDLLKLYEQKISEGHPVFVAKYGIGNEKPKQNSFAAIESNFELTKVHSGCFDQCDIYKLAILEEE